jgi:hypothetical protein
MADATEDLAAMVEQAERLRTPAISGAAHPNAQAMAEAADDLQAIREESKASSGHSLDPVNECCLTRGCLVHLRAFQPEYVTTLEAERESFKCRLATASGNSARQRRRHRGKHTFWGRTGTGKDG